VFHFSDFGLSLHPVLHTDLVILPNKHLTGGGSGSMMNGTTRKRPWSLQPSEISELIVDSDSDEARVSSDFSLVEGSMPGVSNLNCTAKQPIVTSPGVQFRPVPLMKRMLLTVGQTNRLNSL
jgi:hypothetical protein